MTPPQRANAPHERRGHSRLTLALYRSRGARCGCYTTSSLSREVPDQPNARQQVAEACGIERQEELKRARADAWLGIRSTYNSNGTPFEAKEKHP